MPNIDQPIREYQTDLDIFITNIKESNQKLLNEADLCIKLIEETQRVQNNLDKFIHEFK